MAIAIPIKGPKFVIGADGTYKLGNASDERANGGLLIHLISSSLSGASITVQGQSVQLTQSAAQDAFSQIPYHKLYLNGAAADGSLVTTAITDTSIIYVPAPGLTVALVVASYSSGSATVYFTPCVGGAGI